MLICQPFRQSCVPSAKNRTFCVALLPQVTAAALLRRCERAPTVAALHCRIPPDKTCLPKERLPLAGADVVGKPSRSGSGHADGGTRGQASEASVSARAVRGSRAPLRSGFAHHVGPGQRQPIPAPRVSARAVRGSRAPLRSGFAHHVGPGQRRPIPAPTCVGCGALGSTCECAGCVRSPQGWSWQ